MSNARSKVIARGEVCLRPTQELIRQRARVDNWKAKYAEVKADLNKTTKSKERTEGLRKMVKKLTSLNTSQRCYYKKLAELETKQVQEDEDQRNEIFRLKAQVAYLENELSKLQIGRAEEEAKQRVISQRGSGLQCHYEKVYISGTSLRASVPR